MADINDLKDICISSGTLRAKDLLPRFMGILKDYAPEKFNEFIKGYPELDGWEDFLEADWRIISDDTKMNASDDLFGLLNDIAPEGTMFSSTEGDGSDFGFWSVEEKLLDDDEGEKALKQMAKDGKSTGEVAADIRYDVATALDMAANKAEDLMTKFGLDKIYVLRAQGLSPKAIAKKILKACESKDEGWLGGFYSRQDVLDAMDGGILNKDWKLEKRFGNWGCYVNQNTGRPLVLQVMVSQDRNGDWGYKPVTSDMGPVDTNIQAAKWLKPRLEEWVEKNPDLAKDVPDYEWGWIEKCLGKETANKDRKNLVSSLVKGDKIKLIDTVADGAVVTFIDMITPTKMRILHNGREMSCKTSFIDHKVEESKSEATRYYGYSKDDAIDKEDNDFMWQVAYDWFVDKLPEKLAQYADKAVIDVIDKDSRAYEEIVTMDDYYDYLEIYGPAVIEEITGGFSESKKTESSGAALASIYGDGDVSTHENSADGFYVDEHDPMGFAVLNNDTAMMKELFSGKAVAPEKPWTYAGWHEDIDAPENKDGSYPYVYDWEREYDLNFVNDWKRVVGDKNNEKALELLLQYAPDFIPSAMDFWNAFHAGYSKGLLRKLFDNIFAVVDKDDPDNNYLGYEDYTYDEVAKFLGDKDEAADSRRVDDYADKRFFEPEEFVKYVRKAYGKDGGYVSIDSVVPVSVLDKANRMAQKNGYKKMEAKKSISCNDLVAALQEKGFDVKEDLNGSYRIVAKGDNFNTTDNLLFITTLYPESTSDNDFVSDSAFVRGRVNGNLIVATDLKSVEDIVSVCVDAFGKKTETKKSEGIRREALDDDPPEWREHGCASRVFLERFGVALRDSGLPWTLSIDNTIYDMVEVYTDISSLFGFKPSTEVGHIDYESKNVSGNDAILLDIVKECEEDIAPVELAFDGHDGIMRWVTCYLPHASMEGGYAEHIEDDTWPTIPECIDMTLEALDTATNYLKKSASGLKSSESQKSEGTDEEAFGKFEDAVKSILMDKYGVVDSHGPSDETANSLVLQYGATLRDAFDKGGNNGYDPTSVALLIITRQLREAPQFFDDCKDFTFNKDSKNSESKKSESLTLKQKELKDMARYGEAEDITTISDAEAKELKKKGIETVGVSRGTYGMNGALLRDRDGNKYVITARSSNLFYFV